MFILPRLAQNTWLRWELKHTIYCCFMKCVINLLPLITYLQIAASICDGQMQAQKVEQTITSVTFVESWQINVGYFHFCNELEWVWRKTWQMRREEPPQTGLFISMDDQSVNLSQRLHNQLIAKTNFRTRLVCKRQITREIWRAAFEVLKRPDRLKCVLQ